MRTTAISAAILASFAFLTACNATTSDATSSEAVYVTIGPTWIYHDASLVTPWRDRSTATHDLKATGAVYSGTASLSADFTPQSYLYFTARKGFATSGHRAFTLMVNGGAGAGGAVLQVRAFVNGAWTAGTELGPTCAGGAVPAGAWALCSVPLSAIAPADAVVDGIGIHEASGKTVPTVFFDEIGVDTAPGSTGPAASSVVVVVSPSSASLTETGTRAFAASVTGSINTGVTWSIQEGSAGGAVTSAGVYTAPATAGTFHVVATSQADPTKSAASTVTVTAPAPVTVAVSISPASTSLGTGGSQAFGATVTGTTNANVSWTVQEGAAGGAVSSAGVYTAPSVAGTYHVVATSQADPTKSAVATVVVTAPSGGGSGTYALPSDRVTTWNPGILADAPLGLALGVNRLPVRTTICATVSPSGRQDATDTNAIQAALNACPQNQVVRLAAGTFYVTSPINVPTNRVLRGAGAGVTSLVGTGANYTYGSSWSRILSISNGAGGFRDSVNLTSDAVKGASSVTLASLPSGLAAGELVLIDQSSATDPNVFWGTQAAAPPSGFPRDAWTRGDRAIGQLLEVASVDATTSTVRFTTPFHTTYTTAYAAQLSRLAQYEGGPLAPKTQFAGIEALTVVGATGADNGGVSLVGASNCWLANIEVRDGYGFTQLGNHKLGCFRCVLRDSYIHNSLNKNPGGDGYGITIEGHTSDSLVENNISFGMNKVMVMRASGGGNVIAYNYMDYGVVDGSPGFVEVGLNASHLAGAHYELFEGNQSFNFDADDTWGNARYITVFRNNMSAWDRNSTNTGNRRAVGLMTYHFEYSFVGNVLGTPGMTASPESAFVYEEVYPGYVSFSNAAMWRLGDSNGHWSNQLAQNVLQRTLRDGNFDFVTNAQHWHGVGGYGASSGLTAPASSAMPSSLYLTAKPAFFGSSTWPWVDPAGGTKLYTLPARARYDAGTPNTVP